MIRCKRPAGILCVAGSCLILATACTTVGPDYVEPEISVPDAWHTAAIDGLDEGGATLQTWWQVFNDPELDDLIMRSAGSNLDLREALWRVEEARALRGVAAGNTYPQVAVDGQSSRSQASENGLLSDFVPEDGVEPQNLNSYGVGALWEIDLFGRIRRQVESADATADARLEAYRDVLVSLYAEVALAYLNVRTAQQRLGLAHANVEGQEETLQLTEDRFRAGLVSALDVSQAESNLANTRSLIPVLDRDLELAMNRLAVLLGQSPGALNEELVSPQPIPHEPTTVAIGMPAEVLRQRPDVRQAERDLAAQTARIGVATADLYPSFGLSGFFGVEATSAGDLVDSGSLTWSIGLPIRWDIFSGGRIRSQIRAEEARTQQLLARYEQTVLLALEETEGAMVSYVKEVERRQRLAESVEATKRSLALVLTQYRAGLTDFQNVLDTQRTLLVRQDEHAEAEGLVVASLVRLYRAVGGGWDPDGVPAVSDSADQRVAVAAASPTAG